MGHFATITQQNPAGVHLGCEFTVTAHWHDKLRARMRPSINKNLSATQHKISTSINKASLHICVISMNLSTKTIYCKEKKGTTKGVFVSYA